MAGHDIIVIGASAGGVQTLQELVRGLPADFPAAIFIVVHVSSSSPGLLPQILTSRGKLPAAYAVEAMPIRPGRILIAPPDYHLLIKSGCVCVTRGPKENGFRPAVDPLFRTAARAYGPRVIGIILSGMLDDGTMGLSHIKAAGGIAIVQDPAEASFPSMPASAIQNVDVDRVLPIREMPGALLELVHAQIPEGVERMPNHKNIEPDIAEVGSEALVTGELPYPPTALTCPECGGALWELKNGKLLRFRCHVGHAYTAESLVSEQGNALEAAMWTALRALEESAALRRRMAERARKGNFPAMAKQYLDQAAESEARAAVVRKVLVSEPGQAAGMEGTHPKRSRRESHPGKVNRRSPPRKKAVTP